MTCHKSQPAAPIKCAGKFCNSCCDGQRARAGYAGETCDHSILLGRFKRFAGPNPQAAGERCDTESSFCGPSTACNTSTNVCEHYCCTDADCGHGDCQHLDLFKDGQAAPGACHDEYIGFAGAGGDDSAGGSGG